VNSLYYDRLHPLHLRSFPTRRSSDLSTVPLLRTPSISRSAEPIMKSTCTTLRLPPARSKSSSLMTSPPVSVNLYADGRRRHERRSEEHTSELQSPYDLVCRLLLEKKK